MSNPTNSQPWWHRTNKETLEDRVKNVQNVSDPTIAADDVQRWSKVALFALLAFTTLLSTASYLKFFEKSFGFALSLIMAVLLACIIEFGKNWGSLKLLRIPFFQGWSFIWSEVANTVMWVGLLALVVVTFSASVYNSTQGARQLALLLSHERTHTVFQPNTADIDAQIAAAEKRIADNRGTKWKGTTTVDAQRAIKTETRTVETLQKQREARINQQRADYERETAVKDSQNQFSANSLLAVGGWVELLQIILMFMRVAAERSLDKTASERSESARNIFSQHRNGQQAAEYPFKNQIGFRWDTYGQAKPSPTDILTRQPLWPERENTVPQSPQTVAQQNVGGGDSYADSVLELCRQTIQRDMANFENRQARNATVAARIHKALDEAYTAIKGPGFAPSYRIGLKLYSYLNETVFPSLNIKGYPYEHQVFFIERLYAAFKPQQPV